MDASDMAELRYLLKRVMRNEERRRVRTLVTCTGKKLFTSFKCAEQAARRQARAHEGERFNAYHCSLCHGFHVGEAMADRTNRQRRMKEITHG